MKQDTQGGSRALSVVNPEAVAGPSTRSAISDQRQTPATPKPPCVADRDAQLGAVTLGTVSALVAEVLHLVGLTRGDNHVAPVDHRIWHGVSEGLPRSLDCHDGHAIPLPNIGAAQ